MQARGLAQALQDIWKDYPNFHLVEHEKNFYEKVAVVPITLQRILGVGAGAHGRSG
jgi:hypothetical protein